MKEKLKIGMILDKSLPDMRVEHEAAFLGKAGFDIILLALNFKTKKSYFEEKEYYKIYHLKFKKLLVDKLRPFSGTFFDFYTFIWKRIAAKFVRENNIDILHMHDLYMGIPAMKCNVPFVVDLHENYPASVFSYNWSHKFPVNLLLSTEVWKKKEAVIFNKARGIVVLSESFAAKLNDEYRTLHLKNKFIEFPNVPDLQELKYIPGEENIYSGQGRFTLFYFGVVAERRGIFECLDALHRLQNDLKELHLLIVGPVDNADKNRFYKEISLLKGRITYIKWVDFTSFASLVKEIAIGLSPIIKNDQHESGVANKVFQYMYYKKALIVSNCLPQQKIIEKHNCGYVYESGKVESLIDAVRKAYNNRDILKKMGERGRKAVEEEYNISVFSRAMIDFYHRIADESGKN